MPDVVLTRGCADTGALTRGALKREAKRRGCLETQSPLQGCRRGVSVTAVAGMLAISGSG